MRFIFCGRIDKEDWIKTLEGGEGGSGDETTAKKVITYSEDDD